MSFNVLSLFSGIGGMDLGLERAGMSVVGQSEIDPFASSVLARHWPHVPNLGDITRITEADVERLGPIDLVCGGWPCQDLSVAGKQGGIRASRSGLFYELMRVVRLARPSFVLLENVPALLSRAGWMGAVCAELASSGYDAQWDCIPAQALGAPHRRDRIFIVAYLPHADRPGLEPNNGGAIRNDHGNDPATPRRWQDQQNRSGGDGENLAHADGAGRIKQRRRVSIPAQFPAIERGRRWLPEPGVGRVANGIPARVDRLRGLGNAVVPQVAEHVGRFVMDAVRASASDVAP